MESSKNLFDTDVAIDFYENRYQDGYMEEWDELKKRKVKEVLTLLNLPPKGKALDFGCGNGVFTNIIKQVLPNWDVYGVEISKTAVNNAKRKFPNCSFFGLDEAEKHIKSFDFLFSHHVIEHVQNLEETFATINNYLVDSSYQLHILPCGNKGSFEEQICALRENGIEKDKQNRFFFEEPGHLRRLTTKEFEVLEGKHNFFLEKAYYSNQRYGAIDWITKSSPRFVKKLTDGESAIDENSALKLKRLRNTLLPLTYLQFPYSKYWETQSKWKKNFKDYFKMSFLFLPAMVSKIVSNKYTNKSEKEWRLHKEDANGSEMFLFFKR